MTDTDERPVTNHAICEACWVKVMPDRWPVRVKQDPDVAYVCCFCGNPTWVGIYMRVAVPPNHCRHDVSITVSPEPTLNGRKVTDVDPL